MGKRGDIFEFAVLNMGQVWGDAAYVGDDDRM